MAAGGDMCCSVSDSRRAGALAVISCGIRYSQFLFSLTRCTTLAHGFGESVQ